MSTNLVEAQSFGDFRYREPEFDITMASDISSLYGMQESWAYAPLANKPHTLATNYLDISNSKMPSSNVLPQRTPTFQKVQKESTPDWEEERSQDSNFQSQRRYSQFGAQTQIISATQPLQLAIPAMYSPPSTFTALNAQDDSQNATTLSPLDTRFDPDNPSPASNGTFCFDGRVESTDGAQCIQFPTDIQHTLFKRRCNSLQTSCEARSPISPPSSAGRRRKSEYAEPGSARAVYLAKNRKAASKCRSKQKKQQEDLVEEARDVERKNRTLKAEVDLLKGGLRELMGIVAQHSECSDTRLKTYVQREADRLAAGGQRNSLPSPPLTGSSSGGKGSSMADSSPDET